MPKIFLSFLLIILLITPTNSILAKNSNNNSQTKNKNDVNIPAMDYVQIFPVRHAILVYIEYIRSMQSFQDSQLIKLEKSFNILRCSLYQRNLVLNCNSRDLSLKVNTFNKAFYNYIIQNERVRQRYISLGLTSNEFNRIFELAAVGKAVIKNLLKEKSIPLSTTFNDYTYIEVVQEKDRKKANNLILFQLMTLGVI